LELVGRSLAASTNKTPLKKSRQRAFEDKVERTTEAVESGLEDAAA
jgi:hypothetical protein